LEGETRELNDDGTTVGLLSSSNPQSVIPMFLEIVGDRRRVIPLSKHSLSVTIRIIARKEVSQVGRV